MPKRKILLVEAFDGLSKIWVHTLRGKYDFVVAKTLAEAKEYFLSDGPYDLVVVACRVNPYGVSSEYRANGVEFIRQIRVTYDGLLLVNSANPEFVEEAVRAAGRGPTTFSCHKDDVAVKIVQILGEPW